MQNKEGSFCKLSRLLLLGEPVAPVMSWHYLPSLAFCVCRMETFPAVAEKVLREFQVLLQHSPSPIGSTRMLQLMTINMFAVHNSQLKGKEFLLSTPRQMLLNLRPH